MCIRDRVTKVEFDEGGGVIRVFIDFPRGSMFSCPACGKPVKAYDTTVKEWRHLSFFQYACYLVVRVPRIDCPDDGICLLYTSDAADEEDSVDLGGRRI